MSEQKLEWSAPLCDGKRVDYATAEKAVGELGPDWRIPTDRDWNTVIDRSRHAPAIDTDQVADVALGWHWTSTPCPWAPEAAVFVVDSYFGGVFSSGRGFECFVRAVRAVPGQ